MKRNQIDEGRRPGASGKAEARRPGPGQEEGESPRRRSAVELGAAKPERVGPRQVLQRISEHFSSTWKLLSETNTFLAKTSLMSQYEDEFMAMRSRLKSFPDDHGAVLETKNRLIQIRKGLRLLGYDLSLADYQLSISGFRNETSSDTYTRVVLFIGSREILSKAGEANHETLYGYLDAEPHGEIGQSHCLWYSWKGTKLFLSGSDSEDPAAFETLKTWCELPENRLFLLRHMKERHH